MLKNDTERRREHETVRNGVGFYDFTLEYVKVTGADASDFLDRIFVNSIGSTKVGSGQYSSMLNQDAKIVDDSVVVRLEENTYWVSTEDGERMLNWLNQNKENFDVDIEDLTGQIAMYAVQGPKSRDLLNKVLENNIDDLAYYGIEDNSIDNFDVKVLRAGFTGELGFEVYLEPDKVDKLEEVLFDAGKEYNVSKLETAVVEKSLPVEKGLVLMTDVGNITPIEANLSWSVDWDSEFIGKETLEKERNNGSPYRLRGYTVSGDDDNVQIEEGSTVTYNGEEVGKVTSFAYGYTVEDYIGFVLIDKDKVPKNEPFTIHSNGKEYEATSHRRKFYDLNDDRVKV